MSMFSLLKGAAICGRVYAAHLLPSWRPEVTVYYKIVNKIEKSKISKRTKCSKIFVFKTAAEIVNNKSYVSRGTWNVKALKHHNVQWHPFYVSLRKYQSIENYPLCFPLICCQQRPAARRRDSRWDPLDVQSNSPCWPTESDCCNLQNYLSTRTQTLL